MPRGSVSSWIVAAACLACNGGAGEGTPVETAAPIAPAVAVEPSGDGQEATAQTDGIESYSVALRPWTGDYRGMVERRMIRILVPYSRTHYFLDGASERGVVAAMGRELATEVNRREGLRTKLVNVVFLPTPRDRLIPKLVAGRGDIAAGSLAVTESRRALVDFSAPIFRNVNEVVCTGPGAPTIRAVEDLAGQSVYVPASSSYHESLKELNRTFEERGLSPVAIETLDDRLEPDEILEMVHVGLIPATVISHPLAEFWAQVLPELTVHSDVVVATGRDFAWAFRKDSPGLAEVLDQFVTPRRHRTSFGNIIFRRYLQNITWVRNANASADRERYELTKPLFDRYAAQYELDPLMLTALGYQESRLDQRVRSPVGAIGVMQLMPATAASLEVGDVTELEPNIHAGAAYFRLLLDVFADPGVDRLNQMFFALASYNGGRTRIRRLRRETEEQGLDPNVWFDNVELRSARVIGRENVQYVRNIYKYYLAFRLVEQRRTERASRAPGR